jgi:glycosyltransferase involved in cell wall biosynthesis
LADASVALSVIVIARDEAANIEDCLACVAWAKERIVVEHGSTDDTAALAGKAGARVLQTPDWPGFGPQKNRALDLASHDWVLSIDADERVSAALAMEVVAAMRGAKANAFEIPRMTNFCGQWIRHCGWTPDHVVRLFRKGSARFSNNLVHEQVVTRDGGLGRLQTALLHYSYPTPSHYWRKLEHYSHAWAEQKHREGMKGYMLRATASGLVAFVRSYFFRLGMLDGAMGLAVCTMQAQAAFGKYFELYCLSRQDESWKV